MILRKQDLIVFIAGIVLGLACGFFSAKTIYDRPIEASVKADTVTVTDTVHHYLPSPKDSIRTRYITRYLPLVKTDTVTDVQLITMHDTVAVEVPITSKHYNADEYDAWVSGYEPSLDSIFVYQKTEYITKTVTLSKPPNRFTIGIHGGYGYGFLSKTWEPFVGVGLGIRIF